jgi:hypothetical protein
LDVVEELQRIQKFENRPIEVETLPTNLELTKLFTKVEWKNAIGNNKGSRFAKWSQRVS